MSSLPAECAIAFKEWSQICGLLAAGRQSLIVRKGGIREASGGFSPEHPEFWLYPTYVHQAQQGLRDVGADLPLELQAPAAAVSIRALALVEFLWKLHSEDELRSLGPFHHWTEDTLRARFFYRQPGLWILGVRVFRQEEPWSLQPSAEQLGCKSWVVLDSPVPTARLRPALDQTAWSALMARLQETLGPPTLTEQRGSPA